MRRPGDLRRRIVLQSRVTGQDTFAQRILVWTDYLAGLVTGAAKPITSVTSGTTTLIQCQNHGWTEGQLVRLAGITGFPGLPCTYGVLAPGTNSFSVDLDTTGRTFTLSTASATPVSGVPCSISPLTGREQVNDEAVQAALTHVLTLRFSTMLIDPIKVASLRALFVHGPVRRVFNLTPSVNMDMRNRWLTVQASEGLLQG